MAGPMDGVQVVEIGVWVAAPSAAAILSDWGAHVVKIEPPTGDPFRGMGAGFGWEGLPPQFEVDNRGKRSVAIDLSSDEGHAVALALIERADVFVSNVRYGGLQRLGLDYDRLREVNPTLVYAHLSAYGMGHEESDRAAFDVGAYWARGGLAHMVRSPDGPLALQRGGMGDHFTGANAAGAISAALFHRERIGEGQLVTTSLTRTAAYQLAWDLNQALRRPDMIPEPLDRRASPNPLINCYQVRGGRWIWLLMLEGDRHWPDFCRAVDREEWIEDARFRTLMDRAVNAQVLVSLIDERLAERSFEDWGERFDAHDVWWAPVQNLAEVLEDPVIERSGAWTDVPMPDGSSVRMVATPVDFHGTPWSVRGAPPELGQDTELVLMELGYDWDRIAALKETGVIP